MADVLNTIEIDAEVDRVMTTVKHPLDRYMGIYRLAQKRGEDCPLVKALNAAFVSDILNGAKHG